MVSGLEAIGHRTEPCLCDPGEGGSSDGRLKTCGGLPGHCGLAPVGPDGGEHSLGTLIGATTSVQPGFNTAGNSQHDDLPRPVGPRRGDKWVDLSEAGSTNALSLF